MLLGFMCSSNVGDDNSDANAPRGIPSFTVSLPCYPYSMPFGSSPSRMSCQFHTATQLDRYIHSAKLQLLQKDVERKVLPASPRSYHMRLMMPSRQALLCAVYIIPVSDRPYGQLALRRSNVVPSRTDMCTTLFLECDC